MLYIGEKIGTNQGPKFDIAVDPRGKILCRNAGALSVSIAEKNNLFNSWNLYGKISIKVNEKNVVDLDYTVKQNISNLSDYLNKNPENLTACILIGLDIKKLFKR